MPFVFFVLLAVLALLLISGGYTFWAACVRRKELPWLVEEELQKTSYGKYYRYIHYADTYLKEHNAQEVSVTSFDGLRLFGTWLETENPKGSIILAHGYRSCKLVEFSKVLDFYHNYGLNILLIDQRSHGKSEGRIITFGVKECQDMKKWVSWVNGNQGNRPIILSGLSMGASTVLFLADEDLPKNVKGIIADCGFTSPWEIISSVFRNVTHLPAGPSLWVAELFARVFGGFSLRQKNTKEVLKNSKLPVLMVHGIDDGFVPCEMTQQGYDACTGEKELFLVEGADHGLSYLKDSKRYQEKVLAFLDRNLEK